MENHMILHKVALNSRGRHTLYSYGERFVLPKIRFVCCREDSAIPHKIVLISRRLCSNPTLHKGGKLTWNAVFTLHLSPVDFIPCNSRTMKDLPQSTVSTLQKEDMFPHKSALISRVHFTLYKSYSEGGTSNTVSTLQGRPRDPTQISIYLT